MTSATDREVAGRATALGMSTAAFTLCFAVWTIFSIIGVQIKGELGLNDTQFGLLVGTPILTGSLIRLVLGIWADQIGGRIVYTGVMIAAAAATWMLSWAHSYETFLIAALGVGVAGGSFAVGIAYVSRWYPKEKQGTALGIFGAGNVGAAVTKFLAPVVMVAFGWKAVAQIWAVGLFVMAIVFYLTTKDDPQLAERRRTGARPLSFKQQLEPLGNLQVWRFSLYYFFVFGAFVALALWLPRYYVGVYGLDIVTAGLLGAAYSLPGSLFRILGGTLSDKYGARRVMYWTFIGSTVCTFLLAYPATTYVVEGIRGKIEFHFALGFLPFTMLTFALGFFMSLGKAAVFKHIPVYYPDHVGSVGGIVGLIGGLGGFVLPIAFGMMNDIVGVWTSCFMLLFVLVALALGWMHLAVMRLERKPFDLPEFESPSVLVDWHPDDRAFWTTKGRAIAARNLWISIPALLLAFAVWMVWSVVVVNLPAIGFRYTTDQLFWLAALPGLSGATMRIFYSFTVPIFGGRTWTTFSTASLLIPAIGIGMAVQNPETPFIVMLMLALLCGFGGANFASSMSNISFFFPQAEKGKALGLNAGLGNLGVSVVQFVVPLVITAGVFGALGGNPQSVTKAGQTSQMWLQNAGFIWVPFIIASTLAAWFGMNDIASARASFGEQTVIFKRKHNWVMCWLYIGTFGSFIGYSAGFPLLMKTQFVDVNPLHYAFLGPLIGSMSRSFSGGLCDRLGGARVTQWVFMAMIAGVLGVQFFVMTGQFWGFFLTFMLLFAAAGVGNASTFQMIPTIFRLQHRGWATDGGVETQKTAMQQAAKESAAVLGFSSAIGAYGAFFIPKTFGTSLSLTGSPAAALYVFLVFYISCLVLNWWYYTRAGAEIQFDAAAGAPPAVAAQAAQ